MRFTENTKQNPTFERAYQEFIVDYERNYPKNKIPKISSGWLVGIAAAKDLCIRTYTIEGEVVICANPMWESEGINPYYCAKCSKEKGVFILTAEIPQAGKDFVNDIVKNNREKKDLNNNL